MSYIRTYINNELHTSKKNQKINVSSIRIKE